jgi:hypothetical protein
MEHSLLKKDGSAIAANPYIVDHAQGNVTGGVNTRLEQSIDCPAR